MCGYQKNRMLSIVRIATGAKHFEETIGIHFLHNSAVNVGGDGLTESLAHLHVPSVEAKNMCEK